MHSVVNDLAYLDLASNAHEQKAHGQAVVVISRCGQHRARFVAFVGPLNDSKNLYKIAYVKCVS